jgi:hypothetical protein
MSSNTLSNTNFLFCDDETTVTVWQVVESITDERAFVGGSSIVNVPASSRGRILTATFTDTGTSSNSGVPILEVLLLFGEPPPDPSTTGDGTGVLIPE